jgi:hypothetical protein
MKIVRENINFERGLDPKQAMDLGLVAKWMSLKKGDLLKIKRYFTVDSENRLDDSKSYRSFGAGDFLEINIGPNKYSDGCIGFSAYVENETVRSNDDFFMWGTPLEFDQRLEILTGLKESVNFQRGMDPLKAMKIGKDTLPYKKGDKVKVWLPWEKRLVEVRVTEDEELDTDGKIKIKKFFSSIEPAREVRRIWIRYNGEVKTANLAIHPNSPEQDKWIVNG